MYEKCVSNETKQPENDFFLARSWIVSYFVFNGRNKMCYCLFCNIDAIFILFSNNKNVYMIISIKFTHRLFCCRHKNIFIRIKIIIKYFFNQSQSLFIFNIKIYIFFTMTSINQFPHYFSKVQNRLNYFPTNSVTIFIFIDVTEPIITIISQQNFESLIHFM